MNAEENKAKMLKLAQDGATVELTDIRDENIPGRPLFSKLYIKMNPRHWRIYIWARGASAGDLTVDAEDGIEVLDRLIPAAFWVFEET